MKDWQFNVLFWVAVGGTVFMLVSPALGLGDILDNPQSFGGIGIILAYVLTQKNNITKGHDDPPQSTPVKTGDNGDVS